MKLNVSKRSMKSVTSKNGEKLHRLLPAFKDKLHDLAAPFVNIQFHYCTGRIPGNVVAEKWPALAATSFKRLLSPISRDN
jgi:hypothetical protein